jgi:nitronate monooxygenase
MGGVAGPVLAKAVWKAGCGATVALYKADETVCRNVIKTMHDARCGCFGLNLIPELVSIEKLMQCVRVCIRESQPDVYFTFYGDPGRDVLLEIRRASRLAIVQLGSSEQLRSLPAELVSAVVLQGSEAGGHHLGNARLEDLLKECVRCRPDVLFIAAGGISTGSDIARLCQLGAAGVMMGTVFAASAESNAHPIYKAKVRDTDPDSTVITKAFHLGWEGRPHRVVANETTRNPNLPTGFIATTIVNGKTVPIPRFSANCPTRTTSGDIDAMAMYCGTSCATIHSIDPVQVIVARLKSDLHRLGYPATTSQGA